MLSASLTRRSVEHWTHVLPALVKVNLLNGTYIYLRRTENLSEEQEGMEDRLGEMRKGRKEDRERE